MPVEHPTRTWSTFDAERDEVTFVQDGQAGIRVVTVPREQVLAAVPAA